MTAPSSPDTPDLLDTAAARSKILGRIRSARGRQGEATPGERADAQAWIARQSEGPRPTVSQDVVAHFEAQAARMSSTTERVEGMAAVPQAVVRYLQSHQLPHKAVCWHPLGPPDVVPAGPAGPARRPQRRHRRGLRRVCVVGVPKVGLKFDFGAPLWPWGAQSASSV